MLNILLIADVVLKIISLVIFVCLAMWSIRDLKDHDVFDIQLIFGQKAAAHCENVLVPGLMLFSITVPNIYSHFYSPSFNMSFISDVFFKINIYMSSFLDVYETADHVVSYSISASRCSVFTLSFSSGSTTQPTWTWHV